MAKHPAGTRRGASKELKDPARIFAEGTQVDAAIRDAMRDVRMLHKRMGVPLVGWKDGKRIEIPPDQIVIDGLSSTERT
jgi:hypothetical protein